MGWSHGVGFVRGFVTPDYSGTKHFTCFTSLDCYSVVYVHIHVCVCVCVCFWVFVCVFVCVTDHDSVPGPSLLDCMCGN